MDKYRQDLISVIEKFDFDCDLQNALMFAISPDNEIERFKKMILLIGRLKVEERKKVDSLQKKIDNLYKYLES